MSPGMVSFGEEEGGHFKWRGGRQKRRGNQQWEVMARAIWRLSVTEPERKSGTSNMEAESVRSSGAEVWHEQYGV